MQLNDSQVQDLLSRHNDLHAMVLAFNTLKLGGTYDQIGVPGLLDSLINLAWDVSSPIPPNGLYVEDSLGTPYVIIFPMADGTLNFYTSATTGDARQVPSLGLPQIPIPSLGSIAVVGVLALGVWLYLRR